MINHKRIYKVLLDLIENGRSKREDLISEAVSRLLEPRGAENTLDMAGEARGKVGSILNEMLDSGVIGIEGDCYHLTSTRTVALRIESCEKEMLAILKMWI